MKIAFLFCILGRLAQEPLWRRWMAPHASRASVYVHATRRAEAVQSPWIRRHAIPESIPSGHGEIGLVRAELALLRHALSDPQNAKFVFCSRSCAPIKPFSTVHAALTADRRSWLAPHRANPDRFRRVDPRVLPPWHFWKSSDWIALERTHAEALAAVDFTRAFRCFAPGEHYWASLLSMFGFDLDRETTGQSPTWADWRRWSPPRGHPYTFHRLTTDDCRRLRGLPHLFARKFALDSDLLDHWPAIAGQPLPRES
ncbi:MAG TPA: beta-1,6-N-acetylglucosaminyltransferase [Thermoguttaceae bacterium]|nr:beta-1,6-N-acetylglucosaminyltransferase [Thermoguttaceae bacterium]